MIIAMKLSEEEFNRIRPLQWSLHSTVDKVYNTTTTPIETQLFWFDFLRLIFAPKFKAQSGITKITNFDATQPVLLSDDLELLLPSQMETAMYFADNMKKPPIKFSINITKIIILVVTITIIFIILGIDIIWGNDLFNQSNELI